MSQLDPLSPAALSGKTKTPASISTIGKGFDIAASGGSKRPTKGASDSQPAAGMGLASDSIFEQRGKGKKVRDQHAVDMYEGIALVDSVLEDAEVQRRADARERAARFKNRVGKIGSVAVAAKDISAPTTSGGTVEASEGGRGSAALSSPRVNPMLTVKVAVESSSSKLDGFLYSTAADIRSLAPLVQANLSVGETRARKRREMVNRRNNELADMRRREVAELAGGEGDVSAVTAASGAGTGGDTSLQAVNVSTVNYTDGDVPPSPSKREKWIPATGGDEINSHVDTSHMINQAANPHSFTSETIDGQSPIRGVRPRGYATDGSYITAKDARLKSTRDEVLAEAILHASRHNITNHSSPNKSSSKGGKRSGGGKYNKSTSDKSVTKSGFVPGSSLAGLLDCKERLSRTSILESRRKFTSSFGAPARPALLRQTCAPTHASYQVKYGEVERRGTGSTIAPIPTTALKMRQRLDNNASALSSIQVDVSDASSPSPTQHRPFQGSGTVSGGGGASSPTNGFFLTSTGHAQSDGQLGSTSNKVMDRTVSFMTDRSGLSGTNGGELGATTTVKGNIVPGESAHDDARAKAAHAMQNTTVPDPSLLRLSREPSDFPKRDERSYSAPFKSGVQRQFAPTSLDLSYYPLVEPGITTYGPGRIVGNAREREYTPFGRPCGANTTYNLDLVDEAQRKRDIARKTIDFSKGISRDQNGAFSGVGGVDTSQLAYKDQKGAVLKRVGGTSVSMMKQVGRPEVQRASTTEPPEMSKMDNTMANATKRGFVDFSRATNYPTRSLTYFDEMRENDTRPALEVSDACIARQGPAVSFTKGSGRSSTNPTPQPHRSQFSMASLGGGKRGGEDTYYLNAHSRSTGGASTIVELSEPAHNHLDGIGAGHDSPIHRRAPAVAFPRTSRETAPISRTPVTGDYTKGSTASTFPARHKFYDVKDTTHVPAAAFGPLVSREQREKALTHRYASTDAVYNSMPKDKPKLVISFDKVPPRK